MLKSLHLHEIFFVVLFFISFYAPFFNQIFNTNFSMTDDLLVIIILLFLIFSIIKNKKVVLSKEKLKLCFALFLIFVIGIVGNLVSNYQDSSIGIIVDMISWMKFFVLIIAFDLLIKKENCSKYTKIIMYVFKFTIIIGLILEALNLTNVINLAPYYGRFGLDCFSIFGHPSTTASYFALIACFFFKNGKINFWFLASLILCLLTLRFKSILFVVLLLSYFLYNKLFKKQNLLFKIVILLATGYLIFLIGSIPIQTYFKNADSPRYVALSSSIKLANKFMPIGSGFASFGTIASGKYYSDAYYYLDLYNVRGFSQYEYMWIGDGGWATIIGQFGYFGVVLFIVSLYYIFKCYSKKNKNIILMLIYLLISSTNEISFNNSYGIFYAFLIVILYKEMDRNLKYESFNNENISG